MKTCTNCIRPSCEGGRQICGIWKGADKMNEHVTNLLEIANLSVILNDHINDLEADLCSICKSKNWEDNIHKDTRYTVKILYTQLGRLRMRRNSLASILVTLTEPEWQVLAGEEDAQGL